MVQRNTERLKLGGGGRVDIATQGPGNVAPKNTRGIFDTQQAGIAPQPLTIQSSTNPVVEAILGAGMKFAAGAVQQEQEDAYLDGAAAVGAGLSEEQLESNPLTRAWKTAGYRDTVGRLALADYEANVQKDMPSLREMDPQQVTQYLHQKRRDMAGTFEGMSKQARNQIFTQLLTSERATLAKHNREHSEFIVQTQMRPIQVGASLMISKLTDTQGDPDTNIPAQDAAYSYLYANIWNNPNLPPEARSKLIGEVMENALAQGNVGLYEMIRKFPSVDMPDGSKVAIADLLPHKMQQDLAKAYRTAYEQNKSVVLANWYRDFDTVKIGLDDPSFPKPSFDAYRGMLNAGVSNGAISPERRTSELVSYSKKLIDNDRRGAIATAVQVGDYDAIERFGVSGKEAIDAAVAVQLEKGANIGQVGVSLLQTGLNTGNGHAMRKAGEIFTTAISALMNGTEEVDSSLKNMVMQATAYMDRASSQGNVTGVAAFMEALPEDQRAFMTRMSSLMRVNGDPAASVREAKRLADEDKNMAPAVRADLMRQRNDEMMGVLDRITDRRGLDSAALYITAAISTDATNVQNLTRFRPWFQNERLAEERVFRTRNAIASDYQRLASIYPSMSADQLGSMALAAASARTIPTKTNTITLPAGANIQQLFGVPASADPERIGWAIDALAKPTTEGGSLEFSVRDGQLSWIEYNAYGEQIPHAGIDPKLVGEEVQRQREKQAREANKAVGEGVVRKGSTGVEVTYNGGNTAGIDPALALRIRDRIVSFEDVRDTPYSDGKDGRTSVGVGVNSVNKHYYPKPGPDGKVSPAEISASFVRASDGAINAANDAAITWGLQSEEAVEFFSVLAYQGGEGFARAENLGYPKMLHYIANRDQEQAVTALKATPAYKMAHPERQEWYEKKVRNLTK